MNVPAGDLQLHVVRLPPVREPRAVPLVLLHGAIVGSIASWYFTCAPALSAHRELILYDLRGHGRSTRALTGYDLPTQVADLLHLLDALQLGAVDLIGHSLGAVIALHAAHLHPDRVRRVVLVDPPTPPSASGLLGLGEDHPAPLDAETVLDLLPPGARAVLTGGGRRARRFLEGVTFLLAESTLLRDLDAAPPAPTSLPQPALFLFGEHSACLPTGRPLADRLRAPLITVPGGHFVPLTAPEPLVQHALAFLDA